MAQTTILEPGTDSDTSTDVILTAGATANLGIFVTSGALPDSLQAKVWMDSPGTGDVFVGNLTSAAPAQSVSGPGTFRVERIASRKPFGLYSET